MAQQLAAEPSLAAVVVAVSDRWADGRDISWIWDADFESLVARGIPMVASGRRACDVAVRLKYAGAEPAWLHRDPLRAIPAAAAQADEEGPVAVLATYTAMLDVRLALLGSRVARVLDVAS